MVINDNKAIVRRLLEEGSRGNLGVFDELVAHDCVVHALWPNPVYPPQTMAETPTPELMKAMTTYQRSFFPDWQTSIDDILEADDRVVAVWTQHGTNRQGQRVTRQGITIHRVAHGKIVELWVLWDRLGYFQQLGVVPRTDELLQKAGM